MEWGAIDLRWQHLGLKLPAATTAVESGFYAHRDLLFDVATKLLCLDVFTHYAQLACLFLKYDLAHVWDTPDPRALAGSVGRRV